MSRCYPFPPPGYEKKHTIDVVDALAKEKHKEKKRKKDKDREKKDGKVKKDKSRSKEKKDRRDKHKHKKDKKEKDKDKEKNRGTLNDKKNGIHLNSVNGVRANPIALQTTNHNSGNPNHGEAFTRRFMFEGKSDGSANSNNSYVLAERMAENEKNAVEGPILQKASFVVQAKVQMHARTNENNNCFLPELNQKGNSRQVDARTSNGAMDFSHLQSLTKRMPEKEKNGLGGQIVQKIRLMDREKARMHTRTDDRNGCIVPEPNGKEKGTHVNGRINSTMGSSHSQVAANRNLVNGKNGLRGDIVQKVRLLNQAKIQMNIRTNDVNGCIVPEPNGKENGTEFDGRAINGTMAAKRNLVKVKNGVQGMDQAKVQMHMRTDNGNYHFVPEVNGKCKQADSRTVNGRTILDEATNVKSGVAYGGLGKPPVATNVRTDSAGTDKSRYTKDWNNENKLKDDVRDNEKRKEEKSMENGEVSNGQSKAITGKRKELEINGVFHENGNRPHKLQKPVASSPANPQNGRKCEALKNGSIGKPLRKVSSKRASTGSRHPDSVILDQLLSLPLPEINRTPDDDDQEWLFGNTRHQKSRKIIELDSSEGQTVWSHGMRIESADIFALPYVVPL